MSATRPRFPEAPKLDCRETPEASQRYSPLIAVMVVILSSGCTSLSEWRQNGYKVGPNYCRPPAPVASEWIDSKSKELIPATTNLAGWWTVFQDPKLNALVEQAYRQNLSLRSAGTRILVARAQRDIATGNLLPQSQEVFLDVAHIAASGRVANPPPNRFFDNNAIGFNVAWELDFWGRFRRSIEAAEAELDASVENYDDALVLLISEVASTYVEIRVFQQRLRFVMNNVAIQQKLVEQANSRLEVGVGRRIDQAQQLSNLTDTLALKEQLEIGLRTANNRLCVLLGIPVRDLTPELGDGEIPFAPPEVAVGMPADLLRRRPDVRRAERQVAAQSARIGVGTANLYPRFSLLGSIGYEAENFSDLFSSKALFGSIGPNLRWDIFNYGRLVNGIRVQDALFQTAAVDYQNTVLLAGREVEDGIVLFLRAQRQAGQLTESAKQAASAADEAVVLSKDVKFDLNQAFVTSNFLVGQQDKLARSRGDVAQGLIQIYKALGGGWQIRLNEPAVIPQGEPTPIPEPAPAPIPIPIATKKVPPMGAVFGPQANARPVSGRTASPNEWTSPSIIVDSESLRLP
jgi:NodT family efflux transporter outer membrane factor (OMF) lipoprotein